MRARILAPFALALLAPIPAGAIEPCQNLPPCEGCGCRGGPGFRGPDGKCVGYRRLRAVCGDPPTTLCVFENAPNSGVNRDCVLGDERRPAGRGQSPPPSPPESLRRLSPDPSVPPS